MQMKDADALIASWGGKPCNHPSLDKEYYLGAQAGDYICVQCGGSFGALEVREIEEKRRTE